MPRMLAMPLVAGALLMLMPAQASAQAQDYPAKTVRVIIPLGAGGGGDIFTRALTDELQKRLGRSFVVENRAGGGLNIGTRACAESAPDGHTICVISNEPIVYNQFLFKTLPFNPEKDFEPITNLFFNTLTFAVNPDLKVKTIPELMALAKTRQLSYSTFSFPLAYFMEKLKKQYGVDIVRVPYRSGNEVMTALLSGATPITLLGLANMVPQLQSGHALALRSMPTRARRCFHRCQPLQRRRATCCRSRGSGCSRRPEHLSRSSTSLPPKSRRSRQSLRFTRRFTSIVRSSGRSIRPRHSRASSCRIARRRRAS
jgi:tripartite-type tricarboxylate transporter receptor subunit TctC